MAEQTEVEWPTCEQAGCIGIRLASARVCLAHASEEETATALELAGETGAIDVRGVPITHALLEQLLTAAPRGENEEPLIKGCQFDKATFLGDAEFRGVTFRGDAGFGGATFRGDAWFIGATFSGHAEFRGATFRGGAAFGGATFSGTAGFGGATFSGTAGFGVVTFTHGALFSEAKFSGTAYFDRATFNGHVWFDGVTFSGSAWFGGVTFSGRAWFGGAIFVSDVYFGSATFTGDAGFGVVTFADRAQFIGARFEQARQFGPLLAFGGLVLDEVQFAQPVQIELSSTGVCCRRARFLGGVQFRLRWARVVLDDTDLAAPSILAGIPHLSNELLAQREEETADVWQRRLAGEPNELLAQREEETADVWQQRPAGEISDRPQLVSLRRANVAGLGLSNVSAADCQFAGAHNLDKLRLESDVSFATAPQSGKLGGWRWGGREVIAEERAWRADRSRRFSRHWAAPGWPDWLDDERPSVLDPRQIAGLYRALRKGREDSKDEPGAADFYYGEMEMRRRARPGGNPGGQFGAASRGRVERAILTAYWLVSGYGLRAWRAVAWLIVVTALLAVAFHLVGFSVPPRPVSYWTSLLYAFRATLSLTDNQVTLTAWGQLLQGILRLTGPVLLGLALLALRGRVKR